MSIKPLHTGIGRRALRTNRMLYRAVLEGTEPAETLPTILRQRVVAELHHRGWTDVEVAGHTFMTTYTACRIREEMGLSPRSRGQRA